MSFCSSLSRAELFSGLGELAKNATLFGREHAEGFVRALSKDAVDSTNGGSGEEFSLSDDTLLALVHLGIEAKMSVLAVDAYERAHGMVFEYGHTVSHALEKAYGDGVLPHGIGVCYGMLSSSYAAQQMGLMSKEARENHDAICRLLVHRWPLPEPRPSVEKVMALAMRDSKRGITSELPEEISDVLVTEVGNIITTKTNNLSKFPAIFVEQWLELQGFPRETKPTLEPMEKVEPALVDASKALMQCMSSASDKELQASGVELLVL